jgi:hypothetical protein
MDSDPNAKGKTRLVEGEFPDRDFDIEFWQEQGTKQSSRQPGKWWRSWRN